MDEAARAAAVSDLHAANMIVTNCLVYQINKVMQLIAHLRTTAANLFFFSGVPQRLDAGDLGQPTRYCYLESIYHAWDGGTDHRASLVSHPTRCVAVLGGLH